MRIIHDKKIHIFVNLVVHVSSFFAVTPPFRHLPLHKMESKGSESDFVLNEMYGDERGYSIKTSTTKEPSKEGFTKVAVILIGIIQLIMVFLLVIILGLIGMLLNSGNSTCSCTVDTDSNTMSSVGVVSNDTCSFDVAQKVIELFNSRGYNCSVQQNEIALILQNISQSISYIQRFADEQTIYFQNSTNKVNEIKQSSENITQKLLDIVSTLSVLKATGTSTADVVDNLLLLVQDLFMEVQNTSIIFTSVQPVSCQHIKALLPNSSSGYYDINGQSIYCHMGELCGNDGAWTRLAYLDMADSSMHCPSGFRLYDTNGIRACGRPVSSGGSCSSSATYSSNGISYSQICGRAIGYGYSSPDAADNRTGYVNDINSYYADGLSITRGSPRQHVWTLMAGVYDSQYDDGNCPCN